MGRRVKTREASTSAESDRSASALDALVGFVADLREEEALASVRSHLEAGTPPLEILAACQKGMRLVGSMHEKGQYYMAALIMAGEIMREALELLRPLLAGTRSPEGRGRVLLGTIAGDIHDLGKNLLRDLLECHGFAVRDLGVDVAPAEFLRAAGEFQPHVVAASALITESIPHLRELVTLFEESARRGVRRPPIVIGGGQVDERVFRACGADRWAPDAFEGLRVCAELVGGGQEGQ